MLDKLVKKVSSIACIYLDKMGCVLNEVPKRVKKGKTFSTSPIATLKKKLMKPENVQLNPKENTKAKGPKRSETQTFNHPRR